MQLHSVYMLLLDRQETLIFFQFLHVLYKHCPVVLSLEQKMSNKVSFAFIVHCCAPAAILRERRCNLHFLSNLINLNRTGCIEKIAWVAQLQR